MTHTPPPYAGTTEKKKTQNKQQKKTPPPHFQNIDTSPIIRKIKASWLNGCTGHLGGGKILKS